MPLARLPAVVAAIQAVGLSLLGGLRLVEAVVGISEPIIGAWLHGHIAVAVEIGRQSCPAVASDLGAMA